MGTLEGIIRDGRVVMTEVVELPDGTEVDVMPAGIPGSPIEEGPMDADEIARTLAAMERVEPFEITEAEMEGIEADRRARKELEKARFLEHADRLRGI